jgi:hypothetical protein
LYVERQLLVLLAQLLGGLLHLPEFILLTPIRYPSVRTAHHT